MKPEDIRAINESMKKQIWVNLKNGDLYHVSSVRLDCTDGSDRAVVIYESCGSKICGFSREYSEFLEKFRPENKGENLWTI